MTYTSVLVLHLETDGSDDLRVCRSIVGFMFTNYSYNISRKTVIVVFNIAFPASKTNV